VTYEGAYADIMKKIFSRGALLIELEELNKKSESNLKFIEMEIANREKKNEVVFINSFRLKKESHKSDIELRFGKS